ncbi:hypothetical protein STIV2_A345 [Sulfolobus turreted icosahedral virus 2]|uniref:Major capsid protein jelly-roll domain-containing protein n=1 Tax=Sulfolobus turreted icosahedral virus 2 TaxID=754004 RepID=D5IF00_9VIRU|nr:head protein [Sulfolobus turreted icosahedral virus 2]ADF27771.1 hypothetical protein STIV2_A345 [Sulfolobus turreted icosahedral virus 2]
MGSIYTETLQQTYAWAAGTNIPIKIPRNNFIRKIRVQLIGTISNSGTSAVTLPAAPFPYNLVQTFNLSYEGSKTLYSVSGTGLGILAYYTSRGQNPAQPAPGTSVPASGSVPLNVMWEFDLARFPATMVQNIILSILTGSTPSGVTINANFVITIVYERVTAQEIAAEGGLGSDGEMPLATVLPKVIEIPTFNVPASSSPVHVAYLQPGQIYKKQLIYIVNSTSGINNNDPTEYQLKIVRGVPTDKIKVSWSALQAENQIEYQVAPYSGATAIVDFKKYFNGDLDLTHAPSDSIEYDLALQNQDNVYSLYLSYVLPYYDELAALPAQIAAIVQQYIAKQRKSIKR